MNSLEVWESSLANRAEATWQKYLRHFNRFAEWSGHTSAIAGNEVSRGSEGEAVGEKPS